MSTPQLANLIARSITRAVNDAHDRQTAQVEVTKDELLDDVPRYQNYGSTSKPPAKGTDCIMIFPGGDREQGVIIAMENRQFRLTNLADGEVALYDDLGNVFKLGRAQVELTAVTKAVVTAPIVQVTAATSATIASGASSIQITPAGVAITSLTLTHNGKNIGATHQHLNSGGSGTGGIPV